MDVEVGNYGGAPIYDVVVYAQIGERVEWMRLGRVKQQDSDVRGITVDDVARPAEIDVRAWVEFRDIEQRWWRRDVGGLPVLIHGPSPEAISGFVSSRRQAEYKAELQRMEAEHDASGEPPT